MKTVANARFTIQRHHLPCLEKNFFRAHNREAKKIALTALSCGHKISTDYNFKYFADELSKALKQSRSSGNNKLLIELVIDTTTDRDVNHATALFVDHQNKRILFQDSIGNPIPSDTKKIIMSALPDYSFKDFKIKQQTDALSCTIYTMHNLQCFLRKEEISNNINILSLRADIQNLLYRHWWPEHVKKVNSEALAEFQNIASGKVEGIKILDRSKDYIKYKHNAKNSKFSIVHCAKKQNLKLEEPPSEKNNAFFVPESSPWAELEMTNNN